MYTLESKGNFTIVVNDINLTILANSKCQISDEEFNSSLDIAKLKEYLTITKTGEMEKTEEILAAETNNEKEVNSIFVAHDVQEPLVGNDVFVKQVEDDIKVEKQEEQVSEVENIETMEVIETVETITCEESVIENIENNVEEISNKSTENIEQKVEKQPVAKSKEEKKQKGRPKKNK